MSIFNISLPGGKSYTFNKDKFRLMFPESLIDLALQDLDARTIDITHPIVTPYVMEYISLLMSDVIPPIPTEDLTLASRYLGIPILNLVSQKIYQNFTNLWYIINLNSRLDCNKYYRQIMTYGIRNDWIDLYYNNY